MYLYWILKCSKFTKRRGLKCKSYYACYIHGNTFGRLYFGYNNHKDVREVPGLLWQAACWTYGICIHSSKEVYRSYFVAHMIYSIILTLTEASGNVTIPAFCRLDQDVKKWKPIISIYYHFISIQYYIQRIISTANASVMSYATTISVSVHFFNMITIMSHSSTQVDL